MKLIHNNKQININVFTALNFKERTGGLLIRQPLQTHEALLIKPCNSIHTVGMKYSLDIVYLNKNGVILKLVKNVKPFRFSICLNAYAVLELLPNSIENYDFNITDTILTL